MAHSEKHRFDAASARSVVEFGIAVGYIRHTYKGSLRLGFVDRFLEAVKTADAAEGKTFGLSEAVGCGKAFKESSRVPLSVEIWRCQFLSC